MMLPNAYAFACIEVDGNVGPFDATGHFPVLVGHDPSGEALYLALIELSRSDEEPYQVFGCVKDGASMATYKDGDSLRTHVARKFKVLALRYDPSDLYLPYEFEGILDRTGPLFWMKYAMDIAILYDRGVSEKVISTLTTGRYDGAGNAHSLDHRFAFVN